MTSYIDKITLECLTNYKQQSIKSDGVSLDKTNVKFYRKRIVGLVKDLLYNEDAVFTRNESDFINDCMDHFKMQDQADLFQKEFADMVIPTSEAKEMKEYVSQDQLLMRSKKVNMDSFVKRSGVYKPIMPQRREVDLTNPELRTKGLVLKEKLETVEKENPPLLYAKDTKKKTTKQKKKTTKLFVEIEK